MALEDVSLDVVMEPINDARNRFGDAMFFASMILGPLGPLALIVAAAFGV